MKKFSFAKIASLVFVCAMLLCALAVTTLAADEPVVEIVSNNVYYGEKYQLMYAVNAPEGAKISATDAEGNTIAVVPFAEEPNPVINGVTCKAYILKEGVAAQAIEDVITFTVEYDGKVAIKEYSVLQYIYERINVKKNVEGAELSMFNALLAYAEASDIFLDKTPANQSISNYKYVTVVGGTIDGNNTAGMFLPDATPFANIIATPDYDINAYNVEWLVSVDGGEAVRYDNDQIKALAVSGNMTVTRDLVESECAHEWLDATCETLATCSKCGETTGELAEHTWVDATCEHKKYCSVCEIEEGELADHIWGDWNVTADATCSKAGSKTRTCTVCETATETETIPATGAHADANSDGRCDGCGGVIVISYTLVTDVNNLQAGDKVIIVASDSAYAMSTTQNTNNRGQVAVTKNGNAVSFTTAVQILTLEDGTTNGTFAFYTGSGYLYAASSSSNYLKTETKLSANSSWKITIADGVASVVAQGTYTRNVMQHNSTSGLFSCYASATQKGIAIYEQTITVTCAHDELTDVTTVDPTCTVAGSTTGTCVACGETVTTEIPATGHKNDIVLEAVAPTCVDTGLTAGVKCSVCQTVTTAQDVVPATGEHNDGNGDGLCDVCDLDLNTDGAKADNVLAGIKAPVENVTEAGDVILDVTNETGYDATITWAITGGTNTVSTLSGNTLSVVLADSESTIQLTVTVTVGEASASDVYTINVAKAKAASTTTSINIFGSTGTLSSDSNSISWTDGTITFTNIKGSTAIRTTDTDHYRAYANSTVTISGGTITKIVITCSASSYATVCQTSLTNAGYTATVSGSVVTVELTEGADSINFTSSAQWRPSKIEVTYQ